MPIVRDYSRASQSFLFARVTRAKHAFKSSGRWCSAGEWEGIMKTSYWVALVRAALGGAAIQGLHAQAKLKAYTVSVLLLLGLVLPTGEAVSQQAGPTF